MKEQIPLYSYSGEYAYEHGELKQFHASYQANVACKEAIEQAISDHYGNNRLDAACVDQVVERFGYERVFYVLANTVQRKEWDGRISRDNKEWAKTVQVTPGYGGDKNAYFVVDRCNPGLTDLFITIARKNYALEQEKKPSVRDSLKRNNGRQEHKAKPKVHGGPKR